MLNCRGIESAKNAIQTRIHETSRQVKMEPSLPSVGKECYGSSWQ